MMGKCSNLFKVTVTTCLSIFMFMTAYGQNPADVILAEPEEVTSHTMTVSWEASEDIDFGEYRLFRNTASPVDTSSDLLSVITDRNTLSFNDTELHVSTYYYYKIYVVNSDGTVSSGSNEVNASTAANAYPFADGAEDRPELKWFADSPWGLSESNPEEGLQCWTESPEGSYANLEDASLTLHIDLSSALMPVLSFWTRYSTQVNQDYGRVEISLNGTTWQIAGYWSGSQSTWKKMTIDLTPWALSEDVRIRWRFTSGSSTVSDGWYIDNIRVEESSSTGLPYPFFENFDDSLSHDNWFGGQWLIMPGGRGESSLIHDSPTGNYLQSEGGLGGDNPNSFSNLTTSGVLDLTYAVDPVLTFFQKYDICGGVSGYDSERDYGRVYISTSYGLPGTWIQIYTVNGSNTGSWQRVELDLSGYEVPNVRLRFALDDNRDGNNNWGDESTNGNGWWMDDIHLENRPAFVTLQTPSDSSLHGATLTWNKNNDTDFNRYEIFRSTSSSVDRSSPLLATITDQNTTSYRDDFQLLQPVHYYYRMYVTDDFGTLSKGSNTVMADYSIPELEFPFSDSVTAASTEKWAYSSPWGLSTDAAHSGTHSWSDSPGSNYAPNSNTALTTFINLAGSLTPVLRFWHNYALESGIDWGYVEISTNDGLNWTTIHKVTGIEPNWNEERIDLTSYVGQRIGLRFRLVSNGENQLDGWSIDDISMEDESRIVGYPFYDDMENGIGNWYMDSPWSLTRVNAHSDSSCWTDSPAGSYSNNANTSLTLHIDLSTALMPMLRFWTLYATEINQDYARVEISPNGSSWVVLGYWSGSRSTWKEITIDLTPWQGNNDVRIRWRFTSGSSTVSDGWYIDDIAIDETPVTTLPYPFFDNFDDSGSLKNWHFAQWDFVNGGSSGPYCIHDSPTGNYLSSEGGLGGDNPNSFTALTTSGVIDLSASDNPVLTFNYKYDIEDGVSGYDSQRDYGRVYLSTNYGQPGTWVQMFIFNGTQTSTWSHAVIDLSGYRIPNLRFRFIMDDNRDGNNNWGDESKTSNGWWIDDIAIHNNFSSWNIVNEAVLEGPAFIATNLFEATERIYARVYEPGITDAEGQGAGIQGQLGYGPDGVPPDSTWIWDFPASYLEDDGNYDRYYASLSVGDSLGNYDFAFRFRIGSDNPWIYADIDGNDMGSGGFNIFTPDHAGDLLVTESPDMECRTGSIMKVLPVNQIENIDFRLVNHGPGSLRYTIVECDSSGQLTDYPWLAVNRPQNTLPPATEFPVTLTLDPTALDSDSTYLGTLEIRGNDPDEPVHRIGVTLNTLADDAEALKGYVQGSEHSRFEQMACVEIYQGDSLLQTVTTRSNGYFSIYGLEPGFYDLRAWCRGYYTRFVPNVRLPQTQTLKINMGEISPVTATDHWADYYSSATFYNGRFVRPGDVVTARDADGTLCGIYYVTTPGSYGLMHVYGDDPATPDVDEGAAADDSLSFFINNFPAISEVSTLWTEGLHELNLNAFARDIISLRPGYNLISFSSVPRDSSIRDILASIDGRYSMVKGFDMEWGGAGTYVDSLAGQGFNDLHSMDALHGYWIFMNEAATLTIDGDNIPEATPILLDQGWNLISYLPERSLEPEAVLGSVSGLYTTLNGFDAAGAHTYVPGSQFSDLKQMVNGFGYWIIMIQPAILQYGVSQRGKSALPQLPATISSLQATPDWCDLYGTITLNGTPLPPGTEISVADPDQVLCGSCIVSREGQYGFLHIYGDDPATEDIDEGARNGDELTLLLDDQPVFTADHMPLVWQKSSLPLRRNLDLSMSATALDAASDLPRTWELAQNYPNPFNPDTRIDYQLPEAAVITLTVYTIHGRAVRTLADGLRPAGYYEVIWDGRDENGRAVASGVYLFRLSSPDYSKTHKMLLIK